MIMKDGIKKFIEREDECDDIERWGRSESKRIRGKFEERKIKRGTMEEIRRAIV